MASKMGTMATTDCKSVAVSSLSQPDYVHQWRSVVMVLRDVPRVEICPDVSVLGHGGGS